MFCIDLKCGAQRHLGGGEVSEVMQKASEMEVRPWGPDFVLLVQRNRMVVDAGRSRSGPANSDSGCCLGVLRPVSQARREPNALS